MIELKRNPNAGDRRVRATLKPFKKSHHDSDEIEIHTKIKLVTEDNFRFRQRLKEVGIPIEKIRCLVMAQSTAFSITIAIIIIILKSFLN